MPGVIGEVPMKHSQWKNKVHEIFHTCHEELKKTTKIGKKMLSASKINSSLKESYEELGILTAKAMEENEIVWENDSVKKILDTIKEYKKDLENFEGEVNEIKFSKTDSNEKKSVDD